MMLNNGVHGRVLTLAAAACLTATMGPGAASAGSLDRESGLDAPGAVQLAASDTGQKRQQGAGQQGGDSGAGGYGAGGAAAGGSRGGVEDYIFRGGGGRRVIIILEDDDSDRPDWAGGNTDLNPNRGTPNPTPGVTKGDDYGDLIVVVRDPVTGAPVLVDGEYQVCVTPDCSQVVLTVDGEVPEGVTPIEVDFGRASVARAPDRVIDHSLDEVLDRLATATTVTTDEAGRLVIDGATVDSPLENLAMYIALMTSDPKLTPEILAKLPGDVLDLAASMLAGGADKTGTISLDFLVYENVIMGVVDSGEFYDFSSFAYDRSDYDVSYDYFYTVDGINVLSATVNLQDYLEATQPTVDGLSGASLFAVAADDSLEAIELIHTQIHDGVLPGTLME